MRIDLTCCSLLQVIAISTTTQYSLPDMSSSFPSPSSLPPSLSLTDRTAIVTGSSSGLGRSISLRLAKSGCTVICADLAPVSGATSHLTGNQGKATHELITANGGTAHFRPLDVSDYTAFQDVVAFSVAVSPKGRLDYMINNAGIPGLQKAVDNVGIHTEDPAFSRRVMEVNTMGIWNGTKLAVTQMMGQDVVPFPCDLDVGEELGDTSEEERGSRGVIVNMGSIHGMVAGPSERE